MFLVLQKQLVNTRNIHDIKIYIKMNNYIPMNIYKNECL